MHLTDAEIEVAKKALVTYKAKLFFHSDKQTEIDIVNDILEKLSEE